MSQCVGKENFRTKNALNVICDHIIYCSNGDTLGGKKNMVDDDACRDQQGLEPAYPSREGDFFHQGPLDIYDIILQNFQRKN